MSWFRLNAYTPRRLLALLAAAAAVLAACGSPGGSPAGGSPRHGDVLMPATTGRGRPRNLILTAMIFAVSMMFIDMTIISIAVPPIQRDLAGSQAPHEEAGARP